MTFEWSLALPSLVGGVTLLMAAGLCRVCEKSVFAPATAMLLTWGVALVALSFLPLMGFYHLSAEAVLLYVLGACWFAFVAILTTWTLSRYSRLFNYLAGHTADDLNYSRLLLLWAVVAVFAYPLAIQSILSFGSSIAEISYNIRRSSVAGEPILHPMVSNAFILLGVLTNIVLFGVIRKKVKLLSFAVLVTPLVVISLVVSGRAGLVALIFGWLVILAVFSDKLKLRYFVLPVLFLFFVLYFGGVWVKKFDVEGQSAGNVLVVFADHILGYLYQGPVLFSRYYTGEIDIETNWDMLGSACHILSKIGMCQPQNHHAEFAQYGPSLTGNVYSMYFSIIPSYGLLGLALAFGCYSVFLSVIFYMLKARRVFALVVYPVMFSAIVLSVFSDRISYALYWLIKVFIICIIIRVLFSEKASHSEKDWFSGRKGAI